MWNGRQELVEVISCEILIEPAGKIYEVEDFTQANRSHNVKGIFAAFATSASLMIDSLTTLYDIKNMSISSSSQYKRELILHQLKRFNIQLFEQLDSDLWIVMCVNTWLNDTTGSVAYGPSNKEPVNSPIISSYWWRLCWKYWSAGFSFADHIIFT